MAIGDLLDYFGSAYVKEHDTDIVIGGLDTRKLLMDIYDIWRNTRISANMFKEIRRYRIVFDKFFAPDIHYLFSQIIDYKHRRSNKYRLHQAYKLLLSETWLRSTVEKQPDILDFQVIRTLKRTPLQHQVETFQVYNDKVPKMQLKGFLLSTPPGCLSGDTQIRFNRNHKGFQISLEKAYQRFNQLSNIKYNWDRTIPTYVRSYDGYRIRLHEISDIVASGVREVYRVRLNGGMFIDCTDDHGIMTKTGFIAARDIVGHYVMCDRKSPSSYYVRAISVEYLGLQQTYDIICKIPYHNFVANDIVVHNSGKSYMAIALGAMLHADIQIFVVPKATVDTVWFEEITQTVGTKAKIWASTHNVSLTTNYDYYIFHYEALPLAIYLAKQLVDKKNPFIAVDESHNLNEVNSERTRRFIALVELINCQNTIFATGTPIKAVGLEAIPLLRAIDRFFTIDVEDRFRAIYGLTAKRANDILRNRFGLISYKIPETYMTAPTPIDITRQVEVPNSERFTIPVIKDEMKSFMKERYAYYMQNMKQYIRIYDEGIAIYEQSLKTSRERDELRTYKQYVKIIIEGYDPIAHKEIAHFVKEFETKKIIPALPQGMRSQFKEVLSTVKYVKARVLGEGLSVYEQCRAECAGELARYGKLDEIITNADKKTIIYSSHIKALDIAYAVLLAKGFKTLRVYGQFTKDIPQIVTQFKTDATANPLIATLQSLAASQTLTVANTIIFLNAPFRDYIYNQAYHRTFRIGQDTQTYNFLLTLNTGGVPNISTRSEDILIWSRAQAEEIFGSVSSKEEIAGIVKRLHLNPPTGFEHFVETLKRWKIL